MRLRLHVGLDPDAVIEAVRELPEVGPSSIYDVEARAGGFELRRRAARRRYEDNEMIRQLLRVRLRAARRHGVTEVRARFVRRPSASGIGVAVLETAGYVGANLVTGVLRIPEVLRARRKERVEMINLISRALSPHAVAEQAIGPYRAR